MTNEELRQIRERAEKATAGPWEVGAEVDGVYAGMNTVVRATKPHTRWATRIVSVGQTRKHIKEDSEANAEFIAHAREDIPKLLAEIERYREIERRLREEVIGITYVTTDRRLFEVVWKVAEILNGGVSDA